MVRAVALPVIVSLGSLMFEGCVNDTQPFLAPDVTAPTIIVASPTSARTFETTAEQIAVSGTASDNVGVIRVQWATDRGASGDAVGTAAWSIPAVALQPGANVLTITAQDGAKNAGVVTITITRKLIPAQLAIVTQPSTTTPSGAVLATQPAVQLRDAKGNVVAQSGVVVSASPVGDSAVLRGATTATTDSNGTATFSTLALSGRVGIRTLRFSSGDLVAATSDAVQLTAGAPAQLSISSIAAQVAAAPFAVTVSLLDASGNPTVNSELAGSVVLMRQSGIGLLGGTTTGPLPVGAGAVTLGGVTYSTADSGVALLATVIGVNGDITGHSVVSNAFAVAAAPDVTSPTIAITSPTTAATYSTTTDQVALSGTATDLVGVVRVQWSNDRGGSGTATGTTSWSVPSIALQTGANVITVTAEDAAHNVGSTSLTVTRSLAAAQLTIATPPSATSPSGSVLAQQPAIQLRDAAGNAVTQAGVVVTATIASGGGTLGGTPTATTDANGLAVFRDLSLSGAVGPRTLQFAAPSMSSATATVTLAAGAATKLIVAPIATQVAHAGFAITVTLADDSDNPVVNSGAVDGVSVSVQTGTGAIGGATTATFPQGVSAFTLSGLTYSQPESNVVLAVIGSAGTGRTRSFSGVSNAFTVIAPPAAQLALTTQPSVTATNGAAFSQQPVVQLRDASGAAVAQAGVVVTASIASGAGTLGGTATATTDANGRATFVDLSITGVVGARTLSFGSNGLASVVSNSVNVVAGSSTQLVFANVGSQVAGAPFAVTVTLADISGNPTTNTAAPATITLSLSSAGTIAGTTSGTLAIGASALTISGVVLNATDPAARLNATGSGGAAQGKTGASNAFAVTATPDVSPPTIVITAPTTAATFTTTSASLTVGGTAGDNVGVTSVQWTSSRGGSGSASGTTSWSASVPLIEGANVITVTASDGASNTAAATITITRLVPARLIVTTQPGTAASGIALGQQPSIQVSDANGTAVPQAEILVTASIASGGGHLGGTTTATTNAAGVATFTDLSISGTIGARTIGFAAPGLTPATSTSFNLIAGLPAKLVITPIAAQTVGVPFDVTVTVADASDNVATNTGAPATIALTRQTGTGTLGGTTSATLAVGASSVPINGVTYSVAESGVSLLATGSGAGSSTAGKTGSSAPFAVGAAPDQQAPTIAVTSPATAGIATLARTIAIGGTASDNVGVTSVTWSNDRGGTGSASGTNAWGIASIALASGANVITVTAHDAAGNVGTAVLTVTTATALVVTTAPGNATNAAPFGTQPVLQLRDDAGNNVALSGTVITAAIASGGGALSGASTATTDANGTASFTDLTITGATGVRSLTFSVAPLTATSAPFALGPGAATKLIVSPIATQTAGVAFPVTVTLADASDNPTPNVGGVGTITLSRETGTGVLGGSTSATLALGATTATFSAVTYDIAETVVRVAASGTGGGTSNGKTGSSNAFAVTQTPDGTAPTIAITSPTGASTYSTSANQVALGGTASDNVGVTSVTWSNDRGGSGTAAGTTAWSIATVPLAAGTNVVTVTAFDGAGNTAAATLTITRLVASQLAITTAPPATATNGIPFSTQPVVQLRDANGGNFAQAGVTVTAAIASGGGTLGGTASATTDAAGVATFSDLKITGAIGARTISFSSSGLTGVTSGAIDIVAGAPAGLVITNIASQTAGVPFDVAVSVVDASNNHTTNTGAAGTVSLSVQTGNGALGGTTSVVIPAGTGDATVSGVTYSVAEAGVVLAATGSGAGSVAGATGVSNAFTVAPAPDGTPPTIAITTPTTATTYTTGADHLALGGTATDNVGVTSVTWTSDHGEVGTATGTTSWTIASVTLPVGSTVITVTAHDAANNIGTTTLTVTRVVASHVAVATQPSATATNGMAFAQQPTAQLRDVNGVNVAQAGVTVTAAIASGGGTLGGTTSVTTDASGAAIFTDLKITGTVGIRTLSFSAAGLASRTSENIDVVAGIATKLIVSNIGSQTAGAAFSVTVTLADVNSNPVANTGAPATVTLTRETGTGVVGGTVTGSMAVGASAVTISGVTYDRAESGVVLRATGSGAGSAAAGQTGTSNPFDVAGGADATPPTIAITSPTSASTYSTTATQIAVGGTANDDVGVTSVTWSNDRGGSGTAAGTTSWSIATIAPQPGANVITVVAHDAAGNTGTATLTVTRVVATALAITTQPSSSAASGAPFAQQPEIQLVDANGASVAQSGVAVTAAIASGNGSLGGTTTVTTDASGVASFTNLSITGIVGARTLSFNATGLTGVVSGSINVTAGAASKLAIATIGTQVANAPFDVTVTLVDASGNPVTNSGANGTVTLSRQSGTGSVTGTTSATMAVAASSVTISGVVYGTAESGVTLLASGSGGGSAVAGKSGTSNAFTVSPDNTSNGYSTTFSSTESPLSEGGRWINGATTGRDWTNVQTGTAAGVAFATQFVENSGGSLKDAIAILDPSVIKIDANQFAEGVVHRAAGYQGSAGHEIELLLRFTLQSGVARGYEFLLNSGGGTQIVRWNGPLGDFTVLSTTGSGFSVPADGDVIRAEANGSTLKFYQNGTLKLTATDGTWTTGQSGIGFYVHSGGDNALNAYGWTSWTTGKLP